LVAVILLIIFALMGTVVVVVLLAAVATHRRLQRPPGRSFKAFLVALLSIPTLLAWTVAVGLFRGSNWALRRRHRAGLHAGDLRAPGQRCADRPVAHTDSHAHLVYGQQALGGRRVALTSCLPLWVSG